MNRIEQEIRRLLAMAEAGTLPGYPVHNAGDSCFAADRDTMDLTVYFSGENDVLECRLKELWADEPQLQSCIPLILAAVEKSRGQENHAVVSDELYNYSM